MQTSSFRDFDYAGWSDEGTRKEYDQHFGAVAQQSVDALLDAAGVAVPMPAVVASGLKP